MGDVHEDPLAELALRLRTLRAQRGLQMGGLQQRTGLGRTTVSQALNGQVVPSETTLVALAKALGADVGPMLALREAAVRIPPVQDFVGEAVRGRPISDWDPLDLEVHPAAPAPSVAPARAYSPSGLPGYVHRPHDEDLARCVAAAANGASQMAVLIGSSSTGKTRACWEAIQPLAAAGWWLWRPFDLTRLEAALAEIDQLGPRTVVWLNEAQHYLGAGHGFGERLSAALATLVSDPSRGPVLILGTLWPEHANRYMAVPHPGQADPHAQVRALIANRRINVPDKFDAAAIAAAQALADAGDQQLAAALERTPDGNLAQDLAGGPELLHRYHTAQPAARAVLQAAMDARRLGAGVRLPLAFLEGAAEDYLTDIEYDALPDDWFEEALADLARPVHGNLAPLRRIRTRNPRQAPGVTSPVSANQKRGPVYRLADYLEQYGRHERTLLCPPASFWHSAHDHITDSDDLAQIAQEALHRYRLYWAFYLHRASGVCGPTGGGTQTCVVRMRQTAGDAAGVDALVRHEADAGSIWALLWLAACQENAGERERAEHYLKKAADAGHVGALVRLLALRRDARDTQDAENLARRVVDATGSPQDLLPSMFLRTKGDELKTLKCSKRLAPYMGYIWAAPQRRVTTQSAEDGTPTEIRMEFTVDGAPLMTARNPWFDEDPEEAEHHARQAVEVSGDSDASIFLAHLRAKSGDLPEAEVFARRAAELGEPDTLVDLALWYSKGGEYEKSKELLRDAISAGASDALVELADVLRQTGEEDSIEDLVQQITHLGNASSYILLAHLRYRAGEVEKAQSLTRQAADAGVFPDTFFSDGVEPWLREGAEPWLVDNMTAWWPYGLDPDGTPTKPW
ncbi:helix-turn-helix domain-containing protein [Streptomyces hygroscopicus]|uniref:helix-turn-helix domain-containing protein n=1 Tax=Streptomyces hygroscopicus TaxID=1912 RepID=UPI0009A09E04|nr:helix-turn-helix domain-containing protein [Streptomyces hygroscopicus]